MCRVFIGADPQLWESQTRSIRMDGMVTSVRLENMFWMVLEEIAAREDLNVPQLLHQLYNESIDEGHDLGNFTSFLRVCCLRFIDLQLKGLMLPAGAQNALTAAEILQLEQRSHLERRKIPAVISKQH
ncbi:ribbon-helix-helix domain-containing protein [Pseudogemmobacter bohemicus]|uniref:ribbon-helix-helix domain-containing protein n=1 Tax=Pseudogemmobacter bohemicus TaxID=2250708 RepID=UPI000DD2B786|nr:ribbon-helix-helix domain-containing protein [Pseudogemmobacter bohemicus]